MQKSILITGCSSGIGLCAAQTLYKKGYRVFATARKESDVKKLQSMGLMDSLILDVDSSQSIQSAVAKILEKTGGTLDALFNNSGFAIPGAIEDLSRDMMRAQFETNVFGPLELINQVLPVMRKQGHGRIIQNGSMLGIIAMPFRGAYNASKFALEALNNTLRLELRNSPISVSIIEPGPILTRFRQNALQQYQDNLQTKESVHKKIYQHMEKFFVKTAVTKDFFTLPPDTVVKKLLHALESKNPKAHYFVGFPSHLFAMLRRLLPDWALDRVVSMTLKEEQV
jgi:short-subunit dehydrogenase